MSVLSLGERLEAHEPPEARGRGRDDVSLLVATRHDGALAHATFTDLPRFLVPGDLLVVNTSATLPAALPARLDGRPVELRLSTAHSGTEHSTPGDATAVDADVWIVELRQAGGLPLLGPPVGATVDLPARAKAELLVPYAGSDRLVLARLSLGEPVGDYLRRHGRPIRYGYVSKPWPIEAYQTVFAREPGSDEMHGSAEMPSAGRPFTAELVTRLVSSGVLVAPLQLHTGVSSPELGEPPYPEPYVVPEATARLVNAVHWWGGRVIAVGTTVVRALETVAAPDGTVAAGAGETSLVVTPERGLRAVDGLLSGWHEPQASHLLMLEAAAGSELLTRSYREAAARGYRWHEFGDVHLILP